METLRIAIFTETLPRARLGLQPWRYLGDLAAALRREGHESLVVTSQPGMGEWNGVSIESDVAAADFRTGRGLQHLLSTKRLDGGLFRLTAGLFFSMREPPREPRDGRLVGVFLRAVHTGGDLARRFLDPDLVPEIPLDLHHAALFASRALGTWRNSTRYVHRYLFLWDSDRETAVAAGLPAASCSVVRHPFDVAYADRARATLSPRLSGLMAPGTRRLVFAGPPESSRGPWDLVRTLRWLPAAPPVQVVLLLRDTDTPELTVNRVRHGPHEVLTVRGMVSREEIRAVYQRSGVAVFPYRFVRTALPLVALEAAAAGVPVVTTRVHPLGELEGRAGLVFADPRNPRSLAQAIASVLEGDQAAELDRRNQAWIRASPTWQDVARTYVSAVQS